MVGRLSRRLGVLGITAALLTAARLFPPSAQATQWLSLEGSGYTGVAWSPDGETLATTRENQIRLWHVSGQRVTPRSTLVAESDMLGGLAFSPDGTTIAVGGIQPTGVPSRNAQGVIYRWEVQTGRVLAPLVAEGSYNFGASKQVKYSPDGRLLAFVYALHNGSCALGRADCDV